jgi:hypothetical protein
LVRVAGALQRSARVSDVIARLGGDEFAVLLPETSLDEAFRTAERFRRAVDSEFHGDVVNLTASCGVVGFPEHGATTKNLIQSADGALYAAKDLGRARTVLAGGQPTGGRTSALLSLADEVDRRKGGVGATWRCGLYAEALARVFGLPAERARLLGLAARLQDVGEIRIPEDILSSPRALAPTEWSVLIRHPEISARMVRQIGGDEVAAWVASHHERADSDGYPRGLDVDEIPIEAKILAVAGDYAAMQSNRFYREPLSPARAQDKLREGAGKRFDPDVVEAFLSLYST